MIFFFEIVNIGPFMSYFIHDTAVIDQGASIGVGTKIWHFSHIMAGSGIGENCTIGQNGMGGEGGILGNQVKVKNNVSLYGGVICGKDEFLCPLGGFSNGINP